MRTCLWCWKQAGLCCPPQPSCCLLTMQQRKRKAMYDVVPDIELQELLHTLYADIGSHSIGCAAVATLASRLPARFQQSCDEAMGLVLNVQRGVTDEARAAVADLATCFRSAAKALEALAEAHRVSGEQLAVYSVMLEDAVSSGAVQTSLVHPAAILNAAAPSPEPWFLTSALSAAATHTVGTVLGLCCGLGPCTVTRAPMASFVLGCCGGAQNSVLLSLRDSVGRLWEGVQEGDVAARVEPASGATVSVSVEAGGMGEARVCFSLLEGEVPDTIALHVAALGVPVHGSPFSFTAPLGESEALALLPEACRNDFLYKLTSSWLPGRGYSLLYRGSRDGMTAAAFHELCDDKGPTLVLVRAEGGWTFGGYAGISWDCSSASIRLTSSGLVGPGMRFCDSAFVFSVLGPFCSATRFPLIKGKEVFAVYTYASCGPAFPGGFYVEACASGNKAQATFDSTSNTDMVPTAHGVYEDTLGKERLLFTGTMRWRPVEVEVFMVR